LIIAIVKLISLEIIGSPILAIVWLGTKVRVALCDSTGATEEVNTFESKLRADGEDYEAQVGRAIRIY
jgi:hypothetical protein